LNCDFAVERQADHKERRKKAKAEYPPLSLLRHREIGRGNNAMRSANLHDYPAENARGATIILKKPWQRAVFMGGLFLPIVVLLLTTLYSILAR
jgi:hypothetical protein